jgi:hypothetical protein
MGVYMRGSLFDLRDRLVNLLHSLPGFLTVGIGAEDGKTVFVVSVDASKFQGGVPMSFAGYTIFVRDLGRPIGYAA